MRRILVVDDSSTIRKMVRASLQALPVDEFLEASTGLEGIEKLAVAAVDLMVLDLNMPDMHGLDVLRFVRAQDRYIRLPVIVLTTRGDEESRRAALQAGATLYLTKPFRPEVLADAVTAQLPPAEGETR